MYATDVMDIACACLKSVLRIGVDKDYRTLNWVLILYQTCTTIKMNCKQELKIVLKRWCDICFVLTSLKQTEKMEHLFVRTWMSKSIERRSMLL